MTFKFKESGFMNDNTTAVEIQKRTQSTERQHSSRRGNALPDLILFKSIFHKLSNTRWQY
jgi:hypothetical protein